jgi:hypothetical protein
MSLSVCLSTAREQEAISTLYTGKCIVGCSEPSNVVREVGWNGTTGLGIKHWLSRSPVRSEMRNNAVKLRITHTLGTMKVSVSLSIYQVYFVEKCPLFGDFSTYPFPKST